MYDSLSYNSMYLKNSVILSLSLYVRLLYCMICTLAKKKNKDNFLMAHSLSVLAKHLKYDK